MGQTDQNGGSGFLTTLFYPTVSGGTVTNVYYTLPSDKEPEFYGALLIGLGQRRSFSELRSANAEKPFMEPDEFGAALEEIMGSPQPPSQPAP